MTGTSQYLDRDTKVLIVDGGNSFSLKNTEDVDIVLFYEGGEFSYAVLTEGLQMVDINSRVQEAVESIAGCSVQIKHINGRWGPSSDKDEFLLRLTFSGQENT